jgi:hypothetical protein
MQKMKYKIQFQIFSSKVIHLEVVAFQPVDVFNIATLEGGEKCTLINSTFPEDGVYAVFNGAPEAHLIERGGVINMQGILRRVYDPNFPLPQMGCVEMGPQGRGGKIVY